MRIVVSSFCEVNHKNIGESIFDSKFDDFVVPFGESNFEEFPDRRVKHQYFLLDDSFIHIFECSVALEVYPLHDLIDLQKVIVSDLVVLSRQLFEE